MVPVDDLRVASAAGGQILHDLTRAVCGRSAHSRPALAMHKHTAWAACCSSVFEIVINRAERLITARRAAVMDAIPVG